MMRLSETMHEVDETLKSKPLPVCCVPSALNINHVEPQLSLDCSGASLTGRDKGEAKAVAEGGTPNPAFGTLKMQTSDECHKNFVIFDHCEGQNTVILHPSWLQGLPHQSSVELGSMCEANCFLDRLHAFNCKPIEMFGYHSQAALRPVSGDSRGPALEVRQKLSKMKQCGLLDVASCKAPNMKKQVLRTSTHLDVEKESLSSEFHENTEEINVLLSSDDELSSTGHSPSDVASYCYSETMNGPCISIVGKKRKPEDPGVDEVDDADSGSDKLSSGHTSLNIGRFGSSDSLQFPTKNDHKSIHLSGNIPGMNKMSFTCHVAEQAIGNQCQRESNWSSQMFQKSRLMGTQKRIKIKGNMEHLKKVIPGGNLLDTAGVLGRTIHYVKSLQNKLRDLEAARESASAMHQIG